MKESTSRNEQVKESTAHNEQQIKESAVGKEQQVKENAAHKKRAAGKGECCTQVAAGEESTGWSAGNSSRKKVRIKRMQRMLTEMQRATGGGEYLLE